MQNNTEVKIEQPDDSGNELIGSNGDGSGNDPPQLDDTIEPKTEQDTTDFSTDASPNNDGHGGQVGSDFYTDDDHKPVHEAGRNTSNASTNDDNDHDVGSGALPKVKGKDDDKRKLFVGGLSWDTKEKDLKEYFSKFGEVEGLTYKTDAVTGRPRGFAFIIFTELSSVEQVLATGEHVINGKKVDPKRAKARPGKIFVGGLTNDITNDDVKDYFTKFGNVVDMEVPIDKSTNNRKNYCFITFDDIAVSQELLKSPKQTICGKEVDIKQAVPMAKPTQGGGGGGGGGWHGHDSSTSMRGSGRGRGGGMRGRGGGWGGSYGAPAYDSYSNFPAYSSWGSGGYGQYGVGSEGYGGYDYDGYYEGYDAYAGYEAYPPRGYGRGGYAGKMRGGRGSVARHAPY